MTNLVQQSISPYLQRIVSQAICSPSFAALLIRHPDQALTYTEHAAELPATERLILMSIQDATDLPSYAAKLYAKLMTVSTEGRSL